MAEEGPVSALPLRPAVFVDKDGTLIDDVPYNVDPSRLRFRPAAPEALSRLTEAGYALVIVSNQSGIAHGFFDEAQFARLRQALAQSLLERAGVRLTDFLHCPHAPGPDGAPMCDCRKPAPGMLREAARRHRLDLARSWMVGDTLDDVEAGHRAGCRSVLYDSGGETVWRDSRLRRPELCLSEWDEVVHHLLQAAVLAAAP
jgi:histidinol-phosphate phosphatase family protein